MMILIKKRLILVTLLLLNLIANIGYCQITSSLNAGNFGLPGLADLPTANRLPDGELIFTHQHHRNISMTGITFQALPRIGVSFRYGGLGQGGGWAHGRVNWDRSFDAQLSILNESKYLPAISVGLRDFIGTGWFSSEYIVGTKNFSKLEITAGMGFGRLAGKNSFSNPLGKISSNFFTRQQNNIGRGGTLGTINWFQGKTSLFYGLDYRLGEKISIAAEYNADQMSRESLYMNINNSWNYGIKYQYNDYLSISAQYLYGSQLSLTTHIAVNPIRPPFKSGKELAPIPMRQRGSNADLSTQNNEKLIRKVLAADRFVIHRLDFKSDTIEIDLTNTKFRAISQAVGRVSSTLQRFTADKIKIAKISFYNMNLQVATYQIELDKIIYEQFEPPSTGKDNNTIVAIDSMALTKKENLQRLSWGVGPYFEHRLFNPDLPVSLETGLELGVGYQLLNGLKLSGNFRKSILTNLTDNNRRSNSSLPHVHSDWPLYDLAGQNGHIHNLNFSYVKNVLPGLYARAHAGFLEPFYAGLGGEILYKPAKSKIAIGIDVHQVRKRDFDMLFDLLDYKATVGHLSAYYDAGEMFDIELNLGRYLAGDWGATTTISRKFGSGWEIGGYATLTDVPFETFGEGSFDKAIYVSIPIDWIVGTPNKAKRRITLRPITRDGGAHLSSARKLYRYIEEAQFANFKREGGRLWK